MIRRPAFSSVCCSTQGFGDGTKEIERNGRDRPRLRAKQNDDHMFSRIYIHKLSEDPGSHIGSFVDFLFRASVLTTCTHSRKEVYALQRMGMSSGLVASAIHPSGNTLVPPIWPSPKTNNPKLTVSLVALRRRPLPPASTPFGASTHQVASLSMPYFAHIFRQVLETGRLIAAWSKAPAIDVLPYRNSPDFPELPTLGRLPIYFSIVPGSQLIWVFK